MLLFTLDVFFVVLIQRQDLEKDKIAAAQLRAQSGQLQAIWSKVELMMREIERASSWNGTGGSSDSPASA